MVPKWEAPLAKTVPPGESVSVSGDHIDSSEPEISKSQQGSEGDETDTSKEEDRAETPDR